MTYVTASIEPKQQALEQILASAPGQRRVTIATQQWWLRWPIAYLAAGHPNVSVSMGHPETLQPALEDALSDGRLFFVEFAGTPELANVIDWIRARGLRAVSSTVKDAGGRDLLRVLQVTGPR